MDAENILVFIAIFLQFLLCMHDLQPCCSLFIMYKLFSYEKYVDFDGVIINVIKKMGIYF